MNSIAGVVESVDLCEMWGARSFVLERGAYESRRLLVHSFQVNQEQSASCSDSQIAAACLRLHLLATSKLLWKGNNQAR
jgi:hypothetical protein